MLAWVTESGALMYPKYSLAGSFSHVGGQASHGFASYDFETESWETGVVPSSRYTERDGLLQDYPQLGVGGYTFPWSSQGLAGHKPLAVLNGEAQALDGSSGLRALGCSVSPWMTQALSSRYFLQLSSTGNANSMALKSFADCETLWSLEAAVVLSSSTYVSVVTSPFDGRRLRVLAYDSQSGAAQLATLRFDEEGRLLDHDLRAIAVKAAPEAISGYRISGAVFPREGELWIYGRMGTEVFTLD